MKNFITAFACHSKWEQNQSFCSKEFKSRKTEKGTRRMWTWSFSRKEWLRALSAGSVIFLARKRVVEVALLCVCVCIFSTVVTWQLQIEHKCENLYASLWYRVEGEVNSVRQSPKRLGKNSVLIYKSVNSSRIILLT